MGFAALAAMRIQNLAARDMNDCTAARGYALSAIELGRHILNTDPDWRSRPNGAWIANQAIGDGSLSLDVVDPLDGNLADSPEQAVVLTGTGIQGQARHRTRVKLDPIRQSLTCLSVSLHANADINFGSATVRGDQIVSSNADVIAWGGSIYPQAEAMGAIKGYSYRGGTAAIETARTLPDSSAFDYYKANGTWINVANLPLSGSNRQIAYRLLSPASNPFSSGTNAQGIYVIDCQYNPILISQSRIVGTLVLLNTGSGSAVQSSVSWSPAVQNYPSLLVQGDIDFRTTSTTLTEGGINFNPAGTPYPYPEGAVDADTTDSYPSVIAGLVYGSGRVSTFNSPTISVLVVGSTLSCSGTLNLNYDARFQSNPPPGFYRIQMTPDPQSWKQVVD